ncbi:hypothetical protein [Nocardioides convexus]|uniref:hypothetical protein n=1 Tax=Nocardioides convexus TaxID=2712224 RepID=UPI0024184B18|nr:hypothetical protein [Nocardioides convexus]
MTSLKKASRIHPAWPVAAVAFLALIGAAGFRAAPGALMVPLHDEFGWSTSIMSLAVSINLVLFGLTAPFAAALMDRARGTTRRGRRAHPRRRGGRWQRVHDRLLAGSSCAGAC